MPPVSIARIPFILDSFLMEAFPEIPVAVQWVVFDPARQSGLWMRSTCKPGDMEDSEKGMEGWSRRNGLSLIDIYAPSPLVATDAWQLASRVESAFRRKCIDGIQVEETETSNMGVDKFNKFHVRVTVPWWCWTEK